MNSKTFEEKELKILRDSVDYATNIVGKKLTKNRKLMIKMKKPFK